MHSRFDKRIKSSEWRSVTCCEILFYMIAKFETLPGRQQPQVGRLGNPGNGQNLHFLGCPVYELVSRLT